MPELSVAVPLSTMSFALPGGMLPTGQVKLCPTNVQAVAVAASGLKSTFVPLKLPVTCAVDTESKVVLIVDAALVTCSV